ncbi:3-isopropylmalate dehydratase small subunit [Pseudoclavibacter endophyticus]|uniref:3-isopropylmalate dehydratase small subunit n=1 Tax=Pseudoclavibacter endophyticus TaxID=1778590 RepID=A0A6H9WR83_9MICO|nr:3-isopropylmalate dehydratase small subunit [Pseudoclavibacter endophyticus]KAB1649285.1 3-isopropylmalate dehydratase small subunit [Pseudoclavibacter endophyticus]GGA63856.1 3-isopropylmalate dehydratase small subunit [Pseudoclavibacter endophyticus]
MEKLTRVEGVAVPLRRSNVDTDQIIPAEYLKRVTKTGYDDALFAAWRTRPDFELNQPQFANPRILLAGADFGTGSSREHAVWALRDFGFRAVIGPRFGEIFRGNAGKQGLLVGVVSEADIEQLWAQADADPASGVVDLVERVVTVGDVTRPFEIDDYTRWRLLEGLDDIGLTLQHEGDITAFEQRRASWRPTTLPIQHGTR